MGARLARPETTTGMPEPELLKIERTDIGLDRPDRIVRPDIILNTSRQKAQLLTALAGLIEAIRHETNRTTITNLANKIPEKFLPSLCALPILRGLRGLRGLLVYFETFESVLEARAREHSLTRW